jgi:AcrR family transcriptional regulator
MKTAKPVRTSNKTPDQSTEQKILEAAREVFMKKGFSATRTRDIAEAADINLALLNYYFRSKKKLFDLIMIGKIQTFFGFIGPIIYNENSSLETKIEAIVSSYIVLLMENPDLPYFIVGEARNNPELLLNAMQKKDFLKKSVFIRQLAEKKPGQDPYQFLLSILGMIIFPFLMKPIFQTLTDMADAKYKQMMLQREKLIPVWCKAMLKTSV